MLKSEWTNRDALDCSNITCANCQYNDGVVYTSMPPQYKCTITNEFHWNNDKCDVEFAPIKHGHWLFYEEPDGYYHSECSECGQWCDEDVFLKGKWHYCPNCGAKMDKDEWQEPEINPCRGCDDYDGQGGCKSDGGCGTKSTTIANHGRWIKVEDYYNNHLYECSNCHTWTSLPTEEVNDGNIRYCWSCGARMDGVER